MAAMTSDEMQDWLAQHRAKRQAEKDEYWRERGLRRIRIVVNRGVSPERPPGRYVKVRGL